MRFLVQTLVSALIIAGVSELGRRSTALASILAALPLTSVLVTIWLYMDTGDTERVAKLSDGIFWAILPSFIFLLSLPWLLRRGVAFSPALAVSCGVMLAVYPGYVWVLGKIGVVF